MTDTIAPKDVHGILDRYLIADGFPIVFDYERSHGCRVVDAGTGAEYLDYYGFFASLPLGFNHPALTTPDAEARLLSASRHKPTNSDADSVELARFVETFAAEAMPAPMCHLFFIEGGALAVENAMKAAFDWKVRKNLAAGRGELGSKILHFSEAFHGRSGYTMSVTNTSPMKVAYFPKFEWPRVHNPKLRFPITEEETARVAGEEARAVTEIEQAFADHPHDIAGILIEPIQGEGGDNHFRREFLLQLRALADKHEALLIFDEVQTGFGTTGDLWAWQSLDVAPDVLAFGKKTQVCGVMAGPRIDEVEDNVFRLSSRINSTWGGGLVDMVRCEIILETMRRENILQNVKDTGAHLLDRLHALQDEFPSLVSNARGRGLMCAFDLPSGDLRDAVKDHAFQKGVLLLSSGEASLRMRSALTLSRAEVDETYDRLCEALGAAG